jgi:hypothetical protein
MFVIIAHGHSEVEISAQILKRLVSLLHKYEQITWVNERPSTSGVHQVELYLTVPVKFTLSPVQHCSCCVYGVCRGEDEPYVKSRSFYESEIDINVWSPMITIGASALSLPIFKDLPNIPVAFGNEVNDQFKTDQCVLSVLTEKDRKPPCTPATNMKNEIFYPLSFCPNFVNLRGEIVTRKQIEQCYRLDSYIGGPICDDFPHQKRTFANLSYTVFSELYKFSAHIYDAFLQTSGWTTLQS